MIIARQSKAKTDAKQEQTPVFTTLPSLSQHNNNNNNENIDRIESSSSSSSSVVPVVLVFYTNITGIILEGITVAAAAAAVAAAAAAFKLLAPQQPPPAPSGLFSRGVQTQNQQAVAGFTTASCPVQIRYQVVIAVEVNTVLLLLSSPQIGKARGFKKNLNAYLQILSICPRGKSCQTF